MCDATIPDQRATPPSSTKFLDTSPHPRLAPGTLRGRRRASNPSTLPPKHPLALRSVLQVMTASPPAHPTMADLTSSFSQQAFSHQHPPCTHVLSHPLSPHLPKVYQPFPPQSSLLWFVDSITVNLWYVLFGGLGGLDVRILRGKPCHNRGGYQMGAQIEAALVTDARGFINEGGGDICFE
jgi:hypothetical protein